MSRSRLSLLGLAALAACLAAPTQAFLISQSTQGVLLRQGVRLTDHTVRATVHEGWADIEEDLSVGPQASSTMGSATPTANLDSWEVTGDFTLPEGSVLTGAFLWNGNTILKAKLKGAAQADAEYEDSVRRNPIVIRPLGDPLIIRKNGANYSMKLYPVKWTGTRRMRVRYLVPLQPDGDGWKIPLGSAFAQEVSVRPSQYELELQNEGGSTLRLDRDGMKTPFSRSIKLVDYPAARNAGFSWSPPPLYHAPYAASLPQKGSIALSTKIDTGLWKGGYVMYKGRLPDSLNRITKLRQEILVLWKWNNPRGFVEFDGDGTEMLTETGFSAITQAEQIREFAQNLTSMTDKIKVGLVTDEGEKNGARFFPLSGQGSDTLNLMREYLDGINHESLLDRYEPVPSTGTGTSNTVLERKAGAQRFAAVLKTAFSLYSQDSGIVRHIVFVAAGNASDVADPSVALPEWPAGLTASLDMNWNGTSYGAHWTGVNLPALVSKYELPLERRNTDNFYTVPRSRMSWNLEFQAGPRRFSVDGISDAATPDAPSIVEFNGHASAAWEKSLSWTLYDETGKVVRTAREPAANWIQLPNDSAVARLWGGSTRHWSETWKTRTVGDIFGFVDPAYSLLAVPSDSLGSTLQARYQLAGLPFLLPSEILRAIDSGKETTRPIINPPITTSLLAKSLTGFSVRALAGSHGLRIALPAGLDASCQLVVRDLRGRILSQWSGDRLASLRTLDWNAGTVRGMVTVELRTPAGRTVLAASIL